MPSLIISVHKRDILLDNYMDSEKCPITKALHRAGQIGLYDSGTIQGELKNGKFLKLSDGNSSYKSLLIKLFGMYNSHFNYTYSYRGVNPCPPVPLATFKHKLEW